MAMVTWRNSKDFFRRGDWWIKHGGGGPRLVDSAPVTISVHYCFTGKYVYLPRSVVAENVLHVSREFLGSFTFFDFEWNGKHEKRLKSWDTSEFQPYHRDFFCYSRRDPTRRARWAIAANYDKTAFLLVRCENCKEPAATHHRKHMYLNI